MPPRRNNYTIFGILLLIALCVAYGGFWFADVFGGNTSSWELLITGIVLLLVGVFLSSLL